MAKEKQEKKKRGIAKRVFKWIGLGLLILLILGVLIFGAPGKVLALLLILLAAHTILPKGTVKWFWLSVAAIVVILIIWVFLPENNEGWQPYKYNFDEELATLETKDAIPPEENAATIYDKLMENYDANDFNTIYSDTNTFDIIYRAPWSSKDYPEAAAWLKQQQSTIETLIEASKLEKCRFPISELVNIETPMNRFPAIRKWAFLLAISANNDNAEERTKESLQKNLSLLQMGKHLCQQPSTTDWLVGIAIEAIGINQLKTFVVTEDATEEYLSYIEKALTAIKYDWSSDFLKILTSDKLSTKRDFSRYYEMNPKGRIRLSRDPLAEIRANCRKALKNEKIYGTQLKDDYERIAYPFYFEKKLIKASTILRWFYVPSNPQKAASIIEAAYKKYYAMAEPDFDWQKEARELPITSLFSMSVRFNYPRLIERLAGMSEKIYYRLHDQYLRLTSNIRGVRIMIALRQYKNKHSHWPETLDEIKPFAPAEIFVDPINGNGFVYKLTEESFTLYSKGKNNIDEDGRRDWPYRETGADDWLIWPPKQRQKPKGQETYKPERNTNSVGNVIPEQNIAELPKQKIEGAKMIVDRIENAHLYAALNDRFTKAFEILTDSALPKKEDGRYAVDGNDLYYIVQHYTTKPMEKDKLEAHKKYIDIQFVLSGEELLAYEPIEGLEVAQPYSEDKDIAFYHAPDKIGMVTLRPGVFCILFPQDGHIPCCQLNGPSNVHKVVIKVKID